MATFEVDYDQEELDSQTGGAFDPIPEGVYLFDIYEAEVKDYSPTSESGKAGLQRLTLTLKVAEGPHAGRQIWENNLPLSPYWASGKPAFQFKQFFGALGLLEDGKLAFDPDDLLGEQIRGVVAITPATESYSAGNRVKRYLSATEEAPDVVVKEPAATKVKAKAKSSAKPGKL